MLWTGTEFKDACQKPVLRDIFVLADSVVQPHPFFFFSPFQDLPFHRNGGQKESLCESCVCT